MVSHSRAPRQDPAGAGRHLVGPIAGAQVGPRLRGVARGGALLGALPQRLLGVQRCVRVVLRFVRHWPCGSRACPGTMLGAVATDFVLAQISRELRFVGVWRASCRVSLTRRAATARCASSRGRCPTATIWCRRRRTLCGTRLRSAVAPCLDTSCAAVAWRRAAGCSSSCPRTRRARASSPSNRCVSHGAVLRSALTGRRARTGRVRRQGVEEDARGRQGAYDGHCGAQRCARLFCLAHHHFHCCAAFLDSYKRTAAADAESSKADRRKSGHY